MREATKMCSKASKQHAACDYNKATYTPTLTGATVWSHPVAERTTTDVRALDVTTESMTQLTDAIFHRRTLVNICTSNQFTLQHRRAMMCLSASPSMIVLAILGFPKPFNNDNLKDFV